MKKQKRIVTTRYGEHIETNPFYGDLEKVFEDVKNFCSYYKHELICLIRDY